MKTFPVIEAFGPTCQGEGPLAGSVTLFIRFGGCDWRCLAAETRVLLPNLRERAIAELQPGDAVLGYARQAKNGPYRLTPAVVEAVRELPPEKTVVLTFDDGTTLMGASDHRLWREFIRKGQVWRSPRLGNYAEMGELTPGAIVKGPGSRIASQPRTLAWKRGYLAGAMDGDGHVGPATIAFKVTSRSFFDTTLEASEQIGAPLREYAEAKTTYGTRLFRAQLPAAYRVTMEDVVNDFRVDDREFCRGYLAGLFDAEGTVPSSQPYIAQNEGPVVERALAAAQCLDIKTTHVRLPGKASRILLCEHPVSLLPYLDIGCEEKRLAAGLRGLRGLRRELVSVESGPTIPLYDIQTSTENFIANGLVSHNCSWCDSPYAVLPEQVREHAEHLSAAEITDRLDGLNESKRCEWVTLSGGNPALFELAPLVAELHERGYKVAVETQGSRWRDWLATVDMLVVSPKPPSSGMVSERHDLQTDRFLATAVEAHGTESRALKIVVFDETDYEWARDLIHDRSDCGEDWQSFLSVGTDQPDPEYANLSLTKAVTLERIAERFAWLCERVTNDPEAPLAVRLGLQLHVVAWGHARAV